MKTFTFTPCRTFLLLVLATTSFNFSTAQNFSLPGNRDIAFVANYREHEHARAENKFSSITPVVEGAASDSKIVLNWFSGLDSTSTYYAVERSFDKMSFTTAGLVLGGIPEDAGTLVFKYKDISPALKGKQAVYYRVKQIASDGTVIYSKILSVVLKA